MFETFTKVIDDILTQRTNLVEQGELGPFKVLVDPAKQPWLLEKFYDTKFIIGNKDRAAEVTLRDRIAQIVGVVIIKIEPNQSESGFKVVPHG